MENGVRVAEGTHVEERNGVEEKLLGLRTDELAVDGSYASKESEEDELFEEAVEDGASSVGYEEAVNGNVEEFSNPDTGIEAEKFDEASETPIEPLNDDETSNDDESSQLDGPLAVSNKEGEAKSTGTAEVELSGFKNEEDTINVAGQAFEQAENGVIDHENAADEAVVNHVRNQVHETQGTIDVNDAKDGYSDLHPKLESDVLVGLQDELKVEVVSETGGSMDNELVDKCVGLQDASTSSSGNLDVEDQGENIATLIPRNEDNEHPSQSGRIQEDVEEEKLIVPLDNAADIAKNDVSLIDNLAEDSNRSDFSDVGFDGSEHSGDLKEINNEDNEPGQSVPQERQVPVEESSNGSSECQDASSEVFKFVVYEHENEKGEANPSVPQNKDELDAHDATGTISCNDTSAVPDQVAGPPHSSMDHSERELIQENREAITGTSLSSSSALSAASVPAPPAASAPAPAPPAASVPAPSRPAGLGRSALLLEPVPRAVHQQQQPRVNGTVSPVQDQLVEDSTNGDGEETDETREKLQMIRVKFLRLAHRLGQTPHNVVVAQVLYRLGLAEQLRGRNGGRVAAFSFDRASAMAEQLEAAGQEPLDFSCTIMVLGKSGVGKSATINSIFDEIKFNTDAFDSGTKKVQDVVGVVQGIKVRVIDTPGLLPSWSDQRKNEKILRSIKQYIKNTPPDIVLYLDRLDMPSRELGDMPLLKTITDIFGPSVWFNAIVVLTHAASAPPEGPNGTPTSYEMFVSQRSQVVQQAIRQAAGDMRLMNPVSLVENHSACRTNRAGQRVLPNGVVWKPHLLLLSFASKILAEANTLLKLQDSPPGKVLASRARSPPLPFLLSSLLQSRPPVKLPVEQYGEDDDLDDDLNDSSDSDDESEYDELPPFKRLTKAELANLSRDQRKAYFKELEYREKLFMKKQLKEEKTRRKMMKKMQSAMQDLPSDYQENAEEESGGAGSIPVPMPDLALPASFDSDNPTHRYRYLDSSQWLVRPVLDTHGWDHDVGYEGINLERLLVVKDKIPVSLSGQISKDKKDTNLQLEMASTLKHSEGKVTSLGFDLQSVGKDMAYTIRSETRFSNWKKNKAVAGLAATLLGDVLTGGLKIEDKLIVNKQAQLVMSAGAMLGRADVAYGGSLEATLRDKDHPLGRFLSTLGVSVMDWRGDLAIGYNCQCQIPVGRATNLIGRVNVNNRGSGQVSVRVNSSDMLQIAFVGLVPLLRKMFSNSQPGQFG